MALEDLSMDIKKLANPGALKTKAYVPGKLKRDVERELNMTGIIKLASNESASGPSSLAQDAYHTLADRLHLYPDSASRDLRAKLSALLGVDSGRITVANGADGVIYNLGMGVIDQDDEIIIPEVTFPMYESITKIMRGTPVYTPLKGYRIDLDAILSAATKRTKAIFLCNPSNPTGDALPRDELRTFLRSVPKEVLIVLDEAYIEFTDPGSDPSSIALINEGMDNLFVIRTFSKLFGIAGLRVGYGIGNRELIELIHRIKEPFNVSSVGEFVALQALEDAEFKERTLEHVKREKEFFYQNLEEMGLPFVRSHTNFILIDLKTAAQTVSEALLHEGVIVRPVTKFGLPTCIRVTLGTHEENERFFEAFRKVMELHGAASTGRR